LNSGIEKKQSGVRGRVRLRAKDEVATMASKVLPTCPTNMDYVKPTEVTENMAETAAAKAALSVSGRLAVDRAAAVPHIRKAVAWTETSGI
jgi:hypothetical protein